MLGVEPGTLCIQGGVLPLSHSSSQMFMQWKYSHFCSLGKCNQTVHCYDDCSMGDWLHEGSHGLQFVRLEQGCQQQSAFRGHQAAWWNLTHTWKTAAPILRISLVQDFLLPFLGLNNTQHILAIWWTFIIKLYLFCMSIILFYLNPALPAAISVIKNNSSGSIFLSQV